MLSYLKCIRSHRGTNDPECRNLSKSYLSCRMDRYVPDLPSLSHSQCPAVAISFSLLQPQSFKARATTEACPTNLSKTSDLVVGNFGAWGFSEARERAALIPHLLSDLKL
jgi:hypothetical protein